MATFPAYGGVIARKYLVGKLPALELVYLYWPALKKFVLKGIQLPRFVEPSMTNPCGAFPVIRNANLPPESIKGESSCSCGKLTLADHTTVCSSKLPGSVRTSVVSSLTLALIS